MGQLIHACSTELPLSSLPSCFLHYVPPRAAQESIAAHLLELLLTFPEQHFDWITALYP